MLPENFGINSREMYDRRQVNYMIYLNSKRLISIIPNVGNVYYCNDGICRDFLVNYTPLTLNEFFKLKNMEKEKEFIPIAGKEYLFNVVNNLQTGYKLIFLGKTLNGKFISSIKEDDGCCSIWNYCFPIPETLEVTLEQIAEKFNISVDKLKIKK